MRGFRPSTNGGGWSLKQAGAIRSACLHIGAQQSQTLT